MMFSTTTKNEVYVWRMEKGIPVLVYKKWKKSSQPSKIFNKDLPDRELK